MRHFAKYINGYIHACTYYNLHVLMNWFWKYSLIIHFIGIFSSFLHPSAWKSLRFIEFEFNRASELGVRTHCDTVSLSFFYFLSLSLTLETSFPSSGLDISSISSFIEFEFAFNKNHRPWVWILSFE